MKKQLTRRDFLKGSAASALGIAAMGLLGGCAEPATTTTAGTDAQVQQTTAAQAPSNEVIAPPVDTPWYGTALDISTLDIAETIDTEILICGAGHSGLIASMAAAQSGKKTLVIEKNFVCGTMRDYMGCVDSKVQKAANVTFNKAEMVNEIARYASNRCDQKLIRVWADNSGATLNWLADIFEPMGAQYVAEPHIGTGYHGFYKCFPTHTKFNYPEGESGSTLAQKYAMDNGVEFRFETPLVQLIQDENKKVTGVLAKNEKGQYIIINASIGVLMATGGYSDNLDLVKKLNPAAINVLSAQTSQAGDKGDGIRAGLLIGAEKDADATVMLFDRAPIKPTDKLGVDLVNGFANGYFIMGSQPFLKVNADGERFCNEASPYEFPLHAASLERDNCFIPIWDSNYWECILAHDTIGCSRLVPSPTIPPTYEGIGKDMLDGMLAGAMASGCIQQADTLEELAELLKIPADNLVATVKRYNELAAQGEDTDFGKPAKDLIALNTPPYYGTRAGASILCTLDGLRINTDCKLLDTNHDVIEGVWCVGDCSGGFFANNYPELFVGIAAGRSMTFARRAILNMIGQL